MLKLDLDECNENVSFSKLVEDLTQVSVSLEIVFTHSSEINIDSHPSLKYLTKNWRVFTGSEIPSSSFHSYHVICYPEHLFDEVRDSIGDSVTLQSKLALPSVGFYGFSNQKFGTPSRGDTYANKIRAFQFQSFEENTSDLTKALCLSVGVNGLFCSSWHALSRQRKQFPSDENSHFQYIEDSDSYQCEHTQLLSPETYQSYLGRLFGDKLAVKTFSVLDVGKSYTFSLGPKGYNSLPPMLLLRQEVIFDTTAQFPVNQLFAEVQNVRGY